MIQKETNLVVADNSGARSVRAFTLYGGSTRKTSYVGDIIKAAVKDAIPNGKVKKGDVIAFYHNKKVLIKRIIAVQGDTVEILDNGTVRVNDCALDEPYISRKALGECNTAFPFTVPDSRYFVMGDERETSVDSRSSSVGCVAEENIIGKVYMKILPLDSFGKVK